MPNYKLTYFNIKARAEVARILFAVAGVEYEDFRIERDKWPTYKSGMPFGQVPVLEVDGEAICQSRTIERYLAKKFCLVGKTEWDAAQVNMIIETLEDFRKPIIAIFRPESEEKKKELQQKFIEEQGPQFLDNFEKLLKENNDGKNGHFVGSELTLADISFFNLMENLKAFIGQEFPTSWERWPGLKAVRENTGKHPKIQEWIAKRPKTDF